MGIPIGKMALYTALGGIHPEHCLPVLLDVGTDNEERLKSPIYVGWGHERVRGAEYDDFVEAFVTAVIKRWPHVLLQWEDFAGANAGRLLERYRDRLCTFNDDIQGTAAVTTATILAAVAATGIPLAQQRIAIFGFGSAGIGIANLLVTAMKESGLSEAEARRCFYAVDRHGLLVEGDPALRPEQAPFARGRGEVSEWGEVGDITLADTMRHARPTVLAGVSAQPGAFTEEVVREMARHVERPVIFPLSNPTSCAEARPEDLLRWTEGRALVGTGSPFDPVEVGGKSIHITQTNNSYIFPGLALGILASRARRVSDGMIMASARALAGMSPKQGEAGTGLLPPIAESRRVSLVVGAAVGKQAIAEGLADIENPEQFEAELAEYVWNPVYVPYEREV
jgi:malate dehydrogenase (oxaloacetate-decarboxylating)